jgi:predicted AAA+ superfamily ATPase
LLQPYHEKFSKRIVKTPKLYFYDTGLLCHLLKLNNADQIYLHPFKGSLFENMMIAEFVKRMYHKDSVKDIWFWRDSAGHEVDLIWQENLVLNLVEIKATQTILSDLFTGLEYFEQHAKNISLTKTLVYTGSESQKRTNAEVVSWGEFAQ